MNAFSYIKDATTGVTFSIANDRTQGCASLADGSLEVMIQRRLLHDDGRGVGEPLNETGIDGKGLIIRTLHRVSLAASAVAGAAARRTAVADLMYRPVVAYSPLGGATPAAWVAAHAANFTGIARPLPPSLHLLTAHSWGPTSLLLRISHSFEANEAGSLSAPASVDLATIFAGVTITACTEMTISGNQPLANVPKTTYAVQGGGPSSTLPIVPPAPAGASLTVTLTAMQIRTFMCTTDAQSAAGESIAAAPWTRGAGSA